MDNSSILQSFYSAFQKKDSKSMTSLYHDDVIFSDPAFGTLHGNRAKAMWQMLCANAVDLSVEYRDIETNDHSGSAHWEAHYTFSQTGRKVHNIINATFEFKEGKIISHHDLFDLMNWAGQAMGWKGKLLGGTGFFKRKLQKQTNRLLDKYMSDQ